MICTQNPYGLRAGRLPLSLFEMPELLGQKRCNENSRTSKRPKDDECSEIGHWEADTVVGCRAGKESVVFTLLKESPTTLHCHAHLRQDQ